MDSDDEDQELPNCQDLSGFGLCSDVEEEDHVPILETANQACSSSPAPFALNRTVVEHSSLKGKHSRRGKRLPHAEYAARAMEKATENQLGVPCAAGECPFDRKCGRNFTPSHLIRAAERLYGSKCGRGDDGVPYEDPDYPEKETLKQRRYLMLSWIKHNADDPSDARETYYVEGLGPVCAAFAKAAYHFGDWTWNAYIAAARAGKLQADMELTKVGQSTSIVSISQPRSDIAAFETIQWWVLWLRLEDQAPNEPLIFHRVVVWDTVHSKEYTPDISWWGSSKPLSRPRWVQLRTSALEQLSIEFYGQVSDCDRSDTRLSRQQVELKLKGGGFGVPVCMLGLRERGKKTNFGSCPGCDNAKLLWAQYRSGANRTLGDGVAIKNLIFAHHTEVKAERERAMEWMIACACRADWTFTLDDKCGSNFLYLPSPPGGKFTSFYAGAWQYRCAMQVNIVDNGVLRMSLVPPCLKVGYNFGTTAFFSSLSASFDAGCLGTDVFRQTDGGPDIEAKETHCFHHTLVSCGVVQRLTWLQLRPKHSHNKCDRYNSMVKEQIWPQRGMGGGCDGPWDMEAIIQRALATQNGEPKLPLFCVLSLSLLPHIPFLLTHRSEADGVALV